jgi:hypothetical protein
MNVISWLLDADPSIRWQVMRDITHEPAEVVAAERSRVATEGWGAQLLALQTPDGLWAGNAFSQDRTDTFHGLELLRRLGLDPDSERRGARSASSSTSRGEMGPGGTRHGRIRVLRARSAMHQRQRSLDAPTLAWT